jgi:hypothetical protein
MRGFTYGRPGKKLAVALALSLALSGCSIIHDDLRSSGGAAGAKLDKHLFDASAHKELQLLRATLIVAVASRVAVGTIQTGDDADAFLLRLEQTNAELNYLAGDLGLRSGIAGVSRCLALEPAVGSDNTCDTRSTLFESNLPQLEYKVAGLMYAALPRKEAADFAASAAHGDVLSVTWKFLKLGTRGADGGHRGAAAFRSAEEILAIAKRTCAKPGQPVSTEAAASCLGSNRANDYSLKMLGAESIEPERALAALPGLFDLMRVSCALLPINAVVNEEGVTRATRIERCKKIGFAPALRFGGLQLDKVPPAH